MTAGERLVLLSGGGSLSAGQRLYALATGATAGAKMVARSGLLSTTAAAHLLYDGVAPVSTSRPRPMLVYPGALMSRM